MEKAGVSIPNHPVSSAIRQPFRKMSEALWQLDTEVQRVSLSVLTQLCDCIVWWTQRYKGSKLMTIPEAAKKVPMMYRAQVEGRCQLQRLVPADDATRWAEEWIGETYPEAPQFSEDVGPRSPTVTWRFVTNGGQDDGIIRPVIGARGWPFYPGSSMKGLFRQACTAAQADQYCGDADDLSAGHSALSRGLSDEH